MDARAQKAVKVMLIHPEISPYRLPLFEALDREFDLEVLFCKRKSEDRKWNSALQGHGFSGRILPRMNFGIFLLNYTLPAILLDEQYDVYIVGENPTNIFATFSTLLIAKIRGKPFILWSGVIDTNSANQKTEKARQHPVLVRIYRLFLAAYRKILYQFTDQFIAYSDQTRDHLVRNGANPDDIVIGGQVMPESQLLESDMERINDSYRDSVVILSLGYLRRVKGVENLIQAFKEAQLDDTKLVIAGSGPDEERLRSVAGETTDIDFVGHVNNKQKAAYYETADVFVLPTHHDPWGLVVNEALFYDTPVIVTEAAGVSQFVRESNSGIVVPAGDICALNEALLAISTERRTNGKYTPTDAKCEQLWDISEGVDCFRRAIDHGLA